MLSDLLIPLMIVAAFFGAAVNLGFAGSVYRPKAVIRILTAATLVFIGCLYSLLYAGVITLASHGPLFLRSAIFALVILSGADALADRHRP